MTGWFNSLDNPKTQDNMYPVKDCKLLGVMLADFRLPQLNRLYVCIGLATPTYYDRIEYPQVIGLHTSPNVKFTDSYPD